MRKLKIIECPRDAMQSIKEFIPTDKKIKYVQSLLEVGFDTIDVGSFVSKKVIPQLSDTGEVIKEHKFQSKDFEELINTNPSLKDYCYSQICDACILKYDSKELGVDDVTETDEVVDEL